uniref:Uncharacterized protein n=1 Tax=Mustela putorius furo TaxID=9669 RepID=M3YEE3_MUSPF
QSAYSLRKDTHGHARDSTHLGSGEPARAGSPPEAGHPDPVPISPKPLKIRQRGEGACTSLPLRPAESTSWKLDWTGSLFHGCQERGSQRKPCRARSQPFQLAATLVTAGPLTPEPPLAGSERWPGAFWLHSPHLSRQAEDSQAGRQESPGQGQQRVSGPSRGQRTVGGQRRGSSAGRARVGSGAGAGPGAAAPTWALNRGTEPGGEAALARAASYCQGPRGLI